MEFGKPTQLPIEFDYLTNWLEHCLDKYEFKVTFDMLNRIWLSLIVSLYVKRLRLPLYKFEEEIDSFLGVTKKNLVHLLKQIREKEL